MHISANCASLLAAGAVSSHARPECPLCRSPIDGIELATAAPSTPPQVHRQVTQAPEVRNAATQLQNIINIVQRHHAVPQAPQVQPQPVRPVQPAMPQQQATRPTATQLANTSSSASSVDVNMYSQLSRTLLGLGRGSSSSPFSGPWWPDEDERVNDDGYYRTQLLSDGEVGIMPDTGAHDNLCGSVHALRLASAGVQNGRNPGQQPLEKPRKVSGVGQHSQQCENEVILPIAITDVNGITYEEEYRAPCIEGSAVPMLWGIQSLERNRALIDCASGELYLIGPGGYDLKTSPGTRKFKMKKGCSGRWMLPVSNFVSKPRTTEAGAFTTGTVKRTTTTTSSSSTSTSSTAHGLASMPSHAPRARSPQ